MTKTKVISDYELIDHGLCHAQYFQGCGCTYTRFDYVTTGCGDSFAEALDDALESVAQCGIDADALELAIRTDEGQGDKPWPDSPSASDTDPSEESELYYYVSIRWSEVAA